MHILNLDVWPSLSPQITLHQCWLSVLVSSGRSSHCTCYQCWLWTVEVRPWAALTHFPCECVTVMWMAFLRRVVPWLSLFLLVSALERCLLYWAASSLFWVRLHWHNIKQCRNWFYKKSEDSSPKNYPSVYCCWIDVHNSFTPSSNDICVQLLFALLLSTVMWIYFFPSLYKQSSRTHVWWS